MEKSEQEKKKRLKLKIGGMSCATCVATIEQSLKRLEGVIDVKVNLGNETAHIEYDDHKVKPQDLQKAVVDTGYRVLYEKVIIKIGGMTCAMCATTIEQRLKRLEGIIEVVVNLGAEKAYVTFNPDLVSITEMKRAIEDSGYAYLGIEGEEPGDLREVEREKVLQRKKVKFIVGFTVGGFIMGFGYLGIRIPIPLSYLMLIISAPIFIFISHPIFGAAYRALKNRTLNMDVMYSMGIGVAFLASLLGTFRIVLTQEFMFYDTAILLAAFLTLGRYLETRAKGKSSEAIKRLMGLRPRSAIIIRQKDELEIPIDEVVIGDTVLVRPGERIPVDGEVVAGESYVDEAMVTGELIPKLKKRGSQVVGGTINKNGVLKFKALKVGRETLLFQIIKLVEQAQGSRPAIQRLADTAVSYFIPVVLTIAFISFIFWFLILGSTPLFALTILIAILVVACPCALGLATPTAVTVGIGRGAELGILIKSGEALERSKRLTAVVFDKTGTLTRGKPEVTDIINFGLSEIEVLKIAAAIEKNSTHPLAEAIVARAEKQHLPLYAAEGFQLSSGKGVEAKVNGKEVLIGNRIFIEEKGIRPDGMILHEIRRLEQQGKTVLIITQDRIIMGLIAIADTLKPNAQLSVAELRRMGLKVYMITGDNRRTATAVSREVGIDGVLAEVLPQDKAEEVRRLQDSGNVVAFIGDGINDAPALAQADVGIAIGSGTDIAIESGEIVLIKDDLLDVISAIQLSRKVFSRIKMNLFWAFAYNALLIPVAAGLLYPFFRITFQPEFAGLAMAMSSVTVVSLSLMLRGYTPPVKTKGGENNGN